MEKKKLRKNNALRLFVGKKRKKMPKECINETETEPKYFSEGIASENVINLGTRWSGPGDFYRVWLKIKETRWILCSEAYWPFSRGASNGGYSESELTKDYFMENKIQNVDDWLKKIFRGADKPCIDIIKKNETTMALLTKIFSSQDVEKCERCGKICIETVKFADKKCCEECWKYYHSRFCVNDEKVIEKDTGDELLHEIVLCDREVPSYKNSKLITKFVVSIFAKLTEVQWCVGWRDKDNVVHNTEGKENLESDYFQKHNLSDFDGFVKSKKLVDENKTWVYYRNRCFPEFLGFFLNGNRATPAFEIKIHPQYALPSNYRIDSCLKLNIKKAKMVIDIFASKGYELLNIQTVGGIEETSHLGVARYVISYDNASDFVNNAYSDYKKSKNDAVSYEFDAFYAVFIRNGYTIISEIGLDGKIYIQREKCSEEIKETIRRISALIQKEFYNEECIVEEFDETR